MKNAYQQLMPVADRLYREYRAKYEGRGFAHYQEHADGSRTVTLPGDYCFKRTPEGLLFYRHDGYEMPYLMFVDFRSRMWNDAINAFGRILVDEMMERAHSFLELPENEMLPDAVARAAFRHAKRLDHHLLRPTTTRQRYRSVAKQLYRLVDPNLFSLMLSRAPVGARDSRSYNLLARIRNPEELPPAVVSLYLTFNLDHTAQVEPMPPQDAAAVTRNVRAHLEAIAERDGGRLKRGAWRYLLRMKPRSIAHIAPNRYHANAAFFDALAASGEYPRYTVLMSLLNSWFHLQNLTRPEDREAVAKRFTQYARALARATHKHRSLRRFFEIMDQRLIVDWVASNPPLTRAQANLPISWWYEQALAWHENPDGALKHQQKASEAQKALAKHMEPLRERQRQETYRATREAVFAFAIPTFEEEAVVVTPLDTPAALMREGGSMQHCVSTYDYACIQGSSRIYHLESAEEHSTLELINTMGSWRVNQHYGRNNRAVGERHRRVGERLARAYNEKHPEAHDHLLKDLEARHAQERRNHQAAFLARRASPVDVRPVGPEASASRDPFAGDAALYPEEVSLPF